MTCFRLFALILAAAAASVLCSSSCSVSVVSNSNTAAHGGGAIAVFPEPEARCSNGVRDGEDSANVNVADYGQFDPVPSSRAAINFGPIEHGVPLMPYVPRRPTPPPPPPPDHRKPKHGSP